MKWLALALFACPAAAETLAIHTICLPIEVWQDRLQTTVPASIPSRLHTYFVKPRVGPGCAFTAINPTVGGPIGSHGPFVPASLSACMAAISVGVMALLLRGQWFSRRVLGTYCIA